MTEVLRVIVRPADGAPIVAEFEAESRVQAWDSAMRALRHAPEVFHSLRAVVLEWVGPWFSATWGALLPGDEVKGEDGNTWVVARHLHPRNPHEVELYRLETEGRFTFTPPYDQPVTARRTPEAEAIGLLMDQLGARPL